MPTSDYGVPAYEVVDGEPAGGSIAEAALERLRILARTPASGARSTIACSPPKPGSRHERSTSRRGATRGRSRLRVSTTAAG